MRSEPVSEADPADPRAACGKIAFPQHIHAKYHVEVGLPLPAEAVYLFENERKVARSELLGADLFIREQTESEQVLVGKYLIGG